MGSHDEKATPEGRVSSALDRIEQLVREDEESASGEHVAPRNVEEAVDRLKDKVRDKGK